MSITEKEGGGEGGRRKKRCVVLDRERWRLYRMRLGGVRRVREGGIMSSPSRSERVEGRREGGTAGRKRGGPYGHTAGDCFPRVSCFWESASAPVSQGK